MEINETREQFVIKFRFEFHKFKRVLPAEELDQLIIHAYHHSNISKHSQALNTSILENSRKISYTFKMYFIFKFLFTKFPNMGNVAEREPAAVRARMPETGFTITDNSVQYVNVVPGA